MKEAYRQLRKEKKDNETRFVIMVPSDVADDFDRWAVSRDHGSRKAAFLAMVRAVTSSSDSKAA